MPARVSPLFRWLNAWKPEELTGRLDAIFIATAAGAPMQSVTECRCEPGKGLVGDRYAEGCGHWRQTDGCEVTLVGAEDIVRASRRSPVSFEDGSHRRNLVVSGVPIDAYRGRQVRIGSALLEFHRLRPPCGYLDRLLGVGSAKALGRAAGIGLRVVEAGTIRCGDQVQVLSAE